MLHKKSCILIWLVVCIVALSSCAQAKDFTFDDSITWHSTIDDIKAKYGEPDKEDSYLFPIGKDNEAYYRVKVFEFKSFSFRNIGDCKLTFRFTVDNVLLQYDVYKSYVFVQDYEKVLDELVFEYGEPTVKEQKRSDLEIYETIWDSQFSDTFIKLIYYMDTNTISFTVLNSTYKK